MSGDEIIIRQVRKEDIPSVEGVYHDVIEWLDSIGKPWWNRDFEKWEVISAPFKMENFYLAYFQGVPVGCEVLIDYDPSLWPAAQPGEAIYVHRLATTRNAPRGGVVSRALLDYAKKMAVECGAHCVRLDCNRKNSHLCEIYERNGFKRVGEMDRGRYHAAFYEAACTEKAAILR